MQELVTFEAAHEPLLKPNGHGGYRISVSALKAYSRCGLAKFYDDRARLDPTAPQPKNLSATVYGQVMHYCLMLLEQRHHDGNPDALKDALAAFRYYWHPDHLTEKFPKVDEWLPRQTYGGLRDRGARIIRDYADVLRTDDGRLLALEYEFAVPLSVNGRLHTLYGFIDRLALRRYHNKPYISVEDFKSGKQHTWLRYDMQFTGYSWATTQREFWEGWPDYVDPDGNKVELDTFGPMVTGELQDFFESHRYTLTWDRHQQTGMDLAARRGWWVNVKDYRRADAGWRTERDYSRLALAVDGYVRGREAGAYPITNSGEECRFCPFRRTCGGIGLAPDGVGAP